MKANLPQLKKEEVIVRIWTSEFNIKHPGKGIGHISLELVNYKIYISLWPKSSNSSDEESSSKKESFRLFKSIPHKLLPDYEADLVHEERDPEVIFRFYSLNCQSIMEKFGEFKRMLQGWALLGPIGGFRCKNSESCATMAWSLLKAGDIRSLLSRSEQCFVSSQGSTTSSSFSDKQDTQSNKFSLSQRSAYSIQMSTLMVVKSPDALVELLKKAKENELLKYPETQDIQSDREEKVFSEEVNWDDSRKLKSKKTDDFLFEFPSLCCIDCTNYSESKLYKLISNLGKDTFIRSLDLRFNKHVTKGVLRALTKELKSNEVIEWVDLSGIYPEQDILIALCEMLRMNNFVEIRGIRDAQGVEQKYRKEIKTLSGLNRAIKFVDSSTQYSEVNLSGYSIDDTMIDKLLIPLYKNTTISRLMLNDNCIGNIGLNKIIDLLRKNVTIKVINLEGNCLQSKDGTNLDELIAIIKIRIQKNNIIFFKLGRNYLSSKAIRYLKASNYSDLISFDTIPVWYQKNHLTYTEGKAEGISYKSFYVYLVRDTRKKSDNEHVMLLLQKMNKHHQVCIHRAHLTKKKSCGKSSSILLNVLHVRYSHLYDVSKLFIDIRHLVFFCWSISPVEMARLKKAIQQDALKETMKGYNCLMWAKEKLKTINIEVPNKIFDFWPSKLLTRNEYPNESNCVTM